MKTAKPISLLLLCAAAFTIAISSSCKSKKQAVAPSEATGDLSAKEKELFNVRFIDGVTHFNIGNYQLAGKLFNACIRDFPSEASPYYYQSRVLYTQSKYDSSALMAKHACERNDENIDYAVWCAFVYKKHIALDYPLKMLNKMHKKFPDNKHLVYALDSVCKVSANPEIAISAWETLIKTSGFQIPYALQLIQYYNAMENYPKVHEWFDQIKLAAPKKAKYYIADGEQYLEEKNTEKAMENFKKAIEVEPLNWKLNTTLFEHYALTNDTTKASLYLRNAYRDLLVGENEVLEFCNKIYRSAKADKKYKIYLPIIAGKLDEKYKQNARAYFTSGSIYSLLGESTQAFNSFKRSAELDPNNYNAWLNSFGTVHHTNNINTFRSLAENAVGYFPVTAGIYVSISLAALELRDWESAGKYGNTGLSYVFDDSMKVQLLKAVGKSELVKGNYKVAIEKLNAGYELHQTDFQLLEWLGDAYFFENETEKAVQFWNLSQNNGNKSALIKKKILEKKYSEK